MTQSLSNLPIGSKVKFGSLYGKAIIWKIADKNHKGYPNSSVTLITDKIIKLMCFDAKEPTNGDSGRKEYGNNRYIYSNIRQWLNSQANSGQWYTAQHSADQAPDASNVRKGENPYSTIPGFLYSFTENERADILSTTHTVGKTNIDGGGTETCTDKVFLLSCTEVGISGNPVCGTKLAMFSDNQSRVATPTPECISNSNYENNPTTDTNWYWWLCDPEPKLSYHARMIYVEGQSSSNAAYCGHYGLRPACNLSSDVLITSSTDEDGCYSVVYNQAPTAPSYVNLPNDIQGGTTITVSWGPSTDPDGNLSGYVLERKVGSGTWTQIYKGSARSLQTAITYGWTSVQYRVKAYDTVGLESAYATSASRIITNNHPPTISGSDSNLGSFSGIPPSYQYTVSDTDGGTVEVQEFLDQILLKDYSPTLGESNTLTIQSDTWIKTLNGSHTLKIIATDSKGESATRTLTLTKYVSTIEFEQEIPMNADDMPTKALVNIQGHFPAGSTLTVWICNNGNDPNPTWEDITVKAQNGQKHFFTNTNKTASNWGVKVKAKLLRGSATETCFIQSIGGNFA